MTSRQSVNSPGAAQKPPIVALAILGLLFTAFMAAVFTLGLRSTTGSAISPEKYAGDIAGLLPFGYAFGAGMIASVNPCGFLMLPGFIGYYIGQETPGEDPNDVTVQHLARAVLFGLMVTLGFVALFAAIGSVISAGGTAIVGAFPWAGLAIGCALAAFGLWILLTGRSFGLAIASRIGRPRGRGIGSAFVYGIAYGAASLSCTLAIFLVVVGRSTASDGVLSGVGQFVSFALGMGVVVISVSLSAAAFKGSVVQTLKGVAPYFQRLSGIFLAGAGVYLIVYWVVLGDIFD